MGVVDIAKNSLEECGNALKIAEKYETKKAELLYNEKIILKLFKITKLHNLLKFP
jgi:hypothetical protein